MRADPRSSRPIWARRWRDAARSRTSQAGYGPAQVLFDVSFAVGAGEVVTLLGRNGMGKTTTIRTLMGLLPAARRHGRVRRRRAARPPALSRSRSAGSVSCPKAGRSFPTLSVEENLVATAAARHGAAAGRCRASTSSSRAWRSGAPTWASSSPAANSRCWRSAAR